MKRLCIVLMILMMATTAHATVQWRDGTGAETPLGSINPGTIDDAIYDNVVAPLDNLLADGRFKCQLAYASASTLTVGAGSVVCSNTAGTVRLMARNAAATTVTWSNIDTGSEAASTVYYVYAIMSAVSDTTFTVSISESSTSPTGVTYYQRLGYFTNDSDSNITGIIDDSNINPIPAGSIQMYGAATAPSGWLICDGSAVSRTTYATLYAVISTTFGTGNGSTTFNLPNFTNCFPYGASTGTDAGNADVGSTGAGSKTITGNDDDLILSAGGGALATVGGSEIGVAPNPDIMPPYLSVYFLIKT